MRPSSKIERWSFRRLVDACTLCGVDTAARPRAFDSRLDLLNGAGNPESVPDITFQNGNAQSARMPLFRAAICEPVDRITVYLNLTTGTPRLASGKPNGMAIELRTGMDCVEEVVLLQPVYPKSYDDAGLCFSWATPVLFSSIVLSGTTLTEELTDPLQSVSLRIHLDRVGLWFAANPIVGALAVP